MVIGGLGTDNAAAAGPATATWSAATAATTRSTAAAATRTSPPSRPRRNRAVVVNLGAGTATGDGHDTLQGIDDVVGSAFNDTISGDEGTNRIDGGPGNDNLDGAAGGGGDPDQGFGGPGADDCQRLRRSQLLRTTARRPSRRRPRSN